MNLRRLASRIEPFHRLVRWEFHRLIGQRGPAWKVALCLASLVVVIAACWMAAPPERDQDTVGRIHQAARLLLLVTPLRDPILRLGQMTLGYAWLRFVVDFLTALTRVALPAVAAGSVATDRRSGRLQELQLTGLSATQIYLAKSLAPALLFLAAALVMLIVFAGALAAEGVPAVEVARLLQEWAGQVLLTAMLTVTLSTLSRSPWTAMIKAYSLQWLLLPALWLPVLLSMDDTWAGLIRGPVLPLPGPNPVDFNWQCVVQAVFTALVCLMALIAGVRGLDPVISGGRGGGRLRRVGRWLARRGDARTAVE
jgi:hypothetical protein